jgi:two-component system CheB/CheR fusion protein
MKSSERKRAVRTPTPASPAPEATPPAEAPLPVLAPPHFVVGIGASAGGLEALGKFFANMPVKSGLSFVVVQHLSPDYKSFMVELLSKRTEIPVLRAEDGVEVKPDHIYLITPKKNLKIYQGRLLLVDPDLARGFNMPIDVFFRSLAEEKLHQSIGVVLSGTGSDGTMGIRAIKDAGGLAMVQSEVTAQFDGMPRSAISTGLADFILPPEAMPQQLVQYVQHPFVAKEKAIARDQSTTGTLMHKIFALLRERCGVDFSNYKPSTIDRRIERRISINQLNNLEEYYNYLETSPREANLLFNELLICVTRFFRDRDSFEFIETSVVPGLLERTAPGELLRVWVPSCSTGEEAYSLAMLFADEMARRDKIWDVKIFATDISKTAIETASLGLYSQSEVADVPGEKLKRFFSKRPEGWQINRQLRQMVVFARHDLLKDPPFTKLDFISCRNVLIYFQPNLQSKVMGLFHFALKPEGILFLGSSETIGELADKFHTVHARHKVYAVRPSSQSGRLQFALPLMERKGRPETVLTGRIQPAGDLRRLETIYHEVINEYAPACIVVDDDNEVLHLLGRAGEYLHHPTGTFTNNVLKLTGHNLSSALATLLHRASREGKEVAFDNIRLKRGRKALLLRLRVKPFRPSEKGRSGLRLIFIEERGSTRSKSAALPEYQPDQTSVQRITELEQELVYTKESLQATVEELETANEELQATNEELLASNEELQSTNEELQSVNEELHTVNVENQNRIEELTELTNDINNLLLTSGVGTMLVDKDLRIRRTSSAALAMARLTQEDIGAPLEVLARSLQFPEVVRLAQNVVMNGNASERLVSRPNGQFLLLRLSPYRTETNYTRGLVVTMIDITERKDREDLIQGILDSTSAHVAVVNDSGDIICVNESWKRFAAQNSAWPEPLGVGQNYFEACRKAAASCPEVGGYLKAFEALLAGEKSHFEAEYPCHSAADQRWFLMTADPLPGKHRGLVITHVNITELKQLEARSRQLAVLVESAGEAIIGRNLEGAIVTWNPAAERLFGYPAAEAVGQPFTILVPSARLAEEWITLERIKKGESVPRFSTRRLAKDGRALHVSLSVAPVRDAHGVLVGISQIAQELTAAPQARPAGRNSPRSPSARPRTIRSRPRLQPKE